MNKKMSNLFKRMLSVLLCLVMVMSLAACNKGPAEEPHTDYVYEENVELNELVLREAQSCFKYLWELAQTDETTGAYGLVRDRYPGSRNIASTATTGFALAAIPYAIEKGWITKEEGQERASKT